MIPTLKDGDIVMLQKNHKSYQTSDLVMYRSKDASSQRDYYVKRVVGSGGDTLLLKDDHVSINGKLLYEPYINTIIDFQNYKPLELELKIPQDRYFLMGDNRQFSVDSRNCFRRVSPSECLTAEQKTVSKDEILGKIKIFWKN